MRVYEPADGEFASGDLGLVLFNHFGSTVSQDTGRDAQVMADYFGHAVLAVDRPGTGGYLPNKRLAEDIATPNGYLAEMALYGKIIDRQTETLGLTNVVAAGRSAGGLAALALARSETISNLTAVHAAEPVGCETMPLKAGQKRYSDYLKRQKELLKDESAELVRPLPPGLPLFPAIGRLLSIPPAAFIDKYHNKKLFATDASLQYASYIAENMPYLVATLEFAEHSMVATPEVYERDILPIARLRDKTARPFEVKQPKGTVHASFDNRDYMNKAIRPTVLRAEAEFIPKR